MQARRVISYVLTGLLVFVYVTSIISVVNGVIEGPVDFSVFITTSLMYWGFAAWYSFCIWLHPEFSTDRGFWQCVRDTFFVSNGINWLVGILLNILLSPIMLVILAFRIIGLVFGMIKTIISDIRDGVSSSNYSSGGSSYYDDDDYSYQPTRTRNQSGFEGRLASLLKGNMDSGRQLLGSGGNYCRSLNFRGFNVNIKNGTIHLTGTIEYHLNNDSISRAMQNGYSADVIESNLKRDMQNVLDRACEKAMRSCQNIAPMIMNEYGIDYDLDISPEFQIRAVE